MHLPADIHSYVLPRPAIQWKVQVSLVTHTHSLSGHLTLGLQTHLASAALVIVLLTLKVLQDLQNLTCIFENCWLLSENVPLIKPLMSCNVSLFLHNTVFLRSIFLVSMRHRPSPCKGKEPMTRYSKSHSHTILKAKQGRVRCRWEAHNI